MSFRCVDDACENIGEVMGREVGVIIENFTSPLRLKEWSCVNVIVAYTVALNLVSVGSTQF